MTLDAEDLDRVRRAVAKAAAIRIEALHDLPLVAGSPDRVAIRALARQDPATLSDEQLQLVRRLMWRYRRQMPGFLVLKANPDDPIVREMAALERVGETANG